MRIGRPGFTITATLALLLAGCPASSSQRCRDVCRREGRCTETVKRDTAHSFDQNECVAACSALERHPEGKLVVERHLACVHSADTCAQVFDCSVARQ
jgi:hypothetical protein